MNTSAARPAELEPGRPFPLGATLRDGGLNIAVFAEHATRVELCLFDGLETIRQLREEAFELFLAGKVFRHVVQSQDVTADPESVAVFGGQSLVLAAEHFS